MYQKKSVWNFVFMCRFVFLHSVPRSWRNLLQQFGRLCHSIQARQNPNEFVPATMPPSNVEFCDFQISKRNWSGWFCLWSASASSCTTDETLNSTLGLEGNSDDMCEIVSQAEEDYLLSAKTQKRNYADSETMRPYSSLFRGIPKHALDDLKENMRMSEWRVHHTELEKFTKFPSNDDGPSHGDLHHTKMRSFVAQKSNTRTTRTPKKTKRPRGEPQRRPEQSKRVTGARRRGRAAQRPQRRGTQNQTTRGGTGQEQGTQTTPKNDKGRQGQGRRGENDQVKTQLRFAPHSQRPAHVYLSRMSENARDWVRYLRFYMFSFPTWSLAFAA